MKKSMYCFLLGSFLIILTIIQVIVNPQVSANDISIVNVFGVGAIILVFAGLVQKYMFE